MQHIRFVEREGQTFRFTVDGTLSDVTSCLAALGVSKTLSGRLRAQGRAVLDRNAHTLAIEAACEPPCVHMRSAEPLSVLYEDDFILAADKPAGLLVHGDGSGCDTLTGRVEDYLAAGEGLLSPQALQRLDADTTGATLFSKAVEFQGLFDALIADHTFMQKRYLALVEGAYPKRLDRIAAPLARDRHDARRMRACAPGQGQDALTLVERLAVTPNQRFSLLLVTLGTGRKHQIRVHLAAKGFPIVGDPLYGPSRAPQVPCGPLMLHAWQESFIHPITAESVRVISPNVGRFEQYVPDVQVLLGSV